MKYSKFSYLYPPRPEYKTPASELDKYDTGEYIAQPKYNGSACMVFTNGEEALIYNRHREPLKVCPEIDFKALALEKGKWYAYCGEYLNKGKIGELNNKESDKFIIWDVLVFAGDYLIGKTTLDRLSLLEKIYPCNRGMVTTEGLELYKHICCTIYKGIYKAPTYMNSFSFLYDDIVQTDLYEGLVLKKREAKLTYGLQPLNNHDWQIKCRKETKLYKF